MAPRARKPAGTSVGGQFAARSHDEGEVEIGTATIPVPADTIVHLGDDGNLYGGEQTDYSEPLDVATCDLSELVAHFTEGWCWQLAIHLHEQTGFELTDVGGQHAVVRDGDRYLDINGWHSRSELEEEWRLDEQSTIEPMTVADAVTWDIEAGEQDLGDEIVLFIARRVMAEHGASPAAGR